MPSVERIAVITHGKPEASGGAGKGLEARVGEEGDLVGAARREGGVRGQLAVFLGGMQDLYFTDTATMKFLVSARLEHHRGQQRHDAADAVVSTVQGFYHSIVVQAIAHGELAADTDARAVADMLAALFWGMGFHAGFVDVDEASEIARQLLQVFEVGLLNSRVGTPVDA